MDTSRGAGTDASRYLRALATQIAAAYEFHTGPRAILLAGSAAEGVSDYLSDLDLIAYYADDLPTDEDLTFARDRMKVTDFRVRSPRANGTYVEEYVVQGIECEVLHTTVAAWERQMDIVLDECVPTSLAQKAIGGLLDGLALTGDDLIGAWKARAACYPDGLRRAMVEHYLRFFPLWQAQERLASRDAVLWYHESLVEASQNILGVLAGLNGLYYSPFQFKRLSTFVGKMCFAPEDLASRLDSLFTLDRASAATELERLVGETIDLVEAHLPDVDTASARRSVGTRQHPWAPIVEPVDHSVGTVMPTRRPFSNTF